MSVAPEEIARVRSATDIVALVSEHVALKKSGQRWTGLCPFHEERTASFSVNAQEGLYYCFGCRASGDAITFVRETQHLDFIDALRQLAERAGIELQEDDEQRGGWRDRSALYDAVERAVSWTTSGSSPRPTPGTRATTCEAAGTTPRPSGGSASDGRLRGGTPWCAPPGCAPRSPSRPASRS